MSRVGIAHRKVALVGNPNVGKSVLFNALTGAYVTVSNYPGTSVEVSRGAVPFDGEPCEIIDTPGMYALLPITEEERVAREILLNEAPDVVIHVLDARNLERMLAMTLQLIEAGLPVILVVNIMDEAERMGLTIDIPLLQEKLGIPVIGAATARKRGLAEIREAIVGLRRQTTCRSSATAAGWSRTSLPWPSCLTGDYRLSPRSLALPAPPAGRRGCRAGERTEGRCCRIVEHGEGEDLRAAGIVPSGPLPGAEGDRPRAP